jgi:zona occludens toxin (predicted ATPase)
MTYYKRFCGCIFKKKVVILNGVEPYKIEVFERIVPCHKEGHVIGTREILNVNGIDTKKIKKLSPEDTARLMVAEMIGEEI